MRRIVTSVAFVFLVLLGMYGQALAAEGGAKVIGVFGDSLGDGVWGGLYAVQKQHPDDKLFRYAKVGSGLTRPDFATWIADLPKNLEADKITVAVVMFGANDLQSLRDDNHKGYNFGTPGWKTVYKERIDKSLAEFAKLNIRVVWIGLPIMRNDDSNKGSQLLNEMFAASVKSKTAVFLPLIDDFKGSDGAFASHLDDAEGHSKQVRAEDGVHFTPLGYAMIAKKVYAAIPPPLPVPPAPAPAPVAAAPEAAH